MMTITRGLDYLHFGSGRPPGFPLSGRFTDQSNDNKAVEAVGISPVTDFFAPYFKAPERPADFSRYPFYREILWDQLNRKHQNVQSNRLSPAERRSHREQGEMIGWLRVLLDDMGQFINRVKADPKGFLKAMNHKEAFDIWDMHPEAQDALANHCVGEAFQLMVNNPHSPDNIRAGTLA